MDPKLKWREIVCWINLAHDMDHRRPTWIQ